MSVCACVEYVNEEYDSNQGAKLRLSTTSVPSWVRAVCWAARSWGSSCCSGDSLQDDSTQTMVPAIYTLSNFELYGICVDVVMFPMYCYACIHGLLVTAITMIAPLLNKKNKNQINWTNKKKHYYLYSWFSHSLTSRNIFKVILGVYMHLGKLTPCSQWLSVHHGLAHYKIFNHKKHILNKTIQKLNI